MLESIGTFRSLKLVFALGAALALAACASDKATTGAGDMAGLGAGGAATPGSTQDFSTNVGDRVFFESDSSELGGDWACRYQQRSHFNSRICSPDSHRYIWSFFPKNI